MRNQIACASLVFPLTFRGFALGRDTERDFYLFEILKLPIKFYVTKCPPDAKDLLGAVIIS